MNFVLALVFGFARAHALIVGGVDVTAHDAIQRSTAAMYSPSANGPGGALCTASLIARNMAVTAAHCVQSGSYAPVMIFGSSVNSPASVQRPVVGMAVNPAWRAHAGRGMDQGDIAVVKFGGGMPAGYKPATISSDDVRRGESAVLAGYGVSDAHTHAGAGVLRKTTVAVANARSGKPEMILDQSHGRGACHGDSGGPAYFQRGSRMVLGGVTNRSYPNSAADDCAHKVVYTKVAAYRPWIEQSEAALNRGARSSGPSGASGVDVGGPMSQRVLSNRSRAVRAGSGGPSASSRVSDQASRNARGSRTGSRSVTKSSAKRATAAKYHRSSTPRAIANRIPVTRARTPYKKVRTAKIAHPTRAKYHRSSPMMHTHVARVAHQSRPPKHAGSRTNRRATASTHSHRKSVATR